jgi:cellulose biosynthesis protein BcsQ
MKIAVFNEKGGVGKTTTAVSLAVRFGLPLIDLDPQATSTKWLARREGGWPTAEVTSAAWVVDCQPGIDAGIAPILASADLVIVPVRVSFPDLATLGDTVNFLSASGAKVALMGGDIDSRSSDKDTLFEALRGYSLPVLGMFTHRKSYRGSGMTGQSAAEIDKIAALELDAIVEAIRKLIK